MALTKDKIVEQLVTVCKLQRREAIDLVDTFIDHIKHGVEDGQRVKLTGLGAFFMKKQEYQRKRRNIPVAEDTPGWRTPSFFPSVSARDRIQYADVAVSRDVD